MPRLAIFNFLIGFLVLSLAAAAGSFIAVSITDSYLKDRAIAASWELLLSRSAHGHTNLFGILHILFGLTLPYSACSLRQKKAQTIGLFFGTVAMSFGMMIKAYSGPSQSGGLWDVVVGGLLSCALLALASHTLGLWQKLSRHP